MIVLLIKMQHSSRHSIAGMVHQDSELCDDFIQILTMEHMETVIQKSTLFQ